MLCSHTCVDWVIGVCGAVGVCLALICSYNGGTIGMANATDCSLPADQAGEEELESGPPLQLDHFHRGKRLAMYVTRGEQETEWEAGVVGVVVARVARPCCLCG